MTTSGNLIFKNGLTSSGLFFTAGGATFNTSSQSIGGTTAMSFDNTVTVTGITLTNSNSNTVSLTNTGAGTLTGTGTFTQGANSTLGYAGSTITINTFNAAAGGNTVIYNSNAAQTLFSPSAGTYNNLTINNSFGTSPQITLPVTSNITVNNTLTMTDGNINLNSNTLTIGTAASTPGSLTHGGTLASGWMYGGIISRFFNTGTIADRSVTGLFPIGTATDFRPFYLASSAAITTGGTATLSYTNPTTTSIVSFVDVPTATNVVRRHDAFWTCTTAGIAGGTYNLSVEGTGFGTVGLVTDLRICLAGSTVGTDGAHAGTTSNPQVNRTGLTLAQLANDFYIGSIDAVSSPLPLTLTEFDGVPAKGGGANLRWVTVSEIDFDYFQLQRSEDGYEFENIAEVKGKGNPSSGAQYAHFDATALGLTYYRLKSVDRDETSSLSEIIQVYAEAGGATTVIVYPNPISNRKFTVEFFDNDPALVQLMLMDQMGRSHLSEEVGSQRQEVELPGSLAPGIYFLKIFKGTENSDHKSGCYLNNKGRQSARFNFPYFFLVDLN